MRERGEANPAPCDEEVAAALRAVALLDESGGDPEPRMAHTLLGPRDGLSSGRCVGVRRDDPGAARSLHRKVPVDRWNCMVGCWCDEGLPRAVLHRLDPEGLVNERTHKVDGRHAVMERASRIAVMRSLSVESDMRRRDGHGRS